MREDWNLKQENIRMQKEYSYLQTKLTKTESKLAIAIEALEFMTMPLIGKNPTVESLLETIRVDEKRGKQALKQINHD